MVGYSGSDNDNDLVDEINNALDGSTIGETFSLIKDIQGNNWSPFFPGLTFTPGQGYMMNVLPWPR